MNHGCVTDVTQQFAVRLPEDLTAAIQGLSLLRQHFGRETISAAVGEISELLVARLIGAERTQRGSFGHDLRLADGRSVEVKARIIDRYGDSAQFNFGRHTATTDEAYCLAWRDDDQKVVQLDVVYKIGTADLINLWGCDQPRYCARTTLGKLKAALS